MMRFCVAPENAERARAGAERLGVDPSEALRQDLLHVARKNGAVVWVEHQLDVGERSVAVIAAWGPAEDWSDWQSKL
jgi:hypothetical protein